MNDNEIDEYRYRELFKLYPTYRRIPWGELPAESKRIWRERYATGWVEQA